MKRRLLYLLTGFTSLAMPLIVEASTSTQVEQFGPLTVPRIEHTATTLLDGRVLIIGGRNSLGTILSAAEIFDPATQNSTAIASLATPRVGHTATVLKDGRVLIAGGSDRIPSIIEFNGRCA